MGALLGAVLSRIFADASLRFVAFKVVLATFFISVLPVVLNNLIYELLEISLSLVGSITPPNLQTVLSYDGLTGWLLATLRIPEALSVVLSAVSYRLTLNMIPFVRL